MPNLRHALVSKVDRATNTDKMYILDLVRIGSSNIHYLVRRWGRRHTGRLQVKAERFEHLDRASSEYRDLLRQKVNDGYGDDPQGITSDGLDPYSLLSILTGQMATQVQNDIEARHENDPRIPQTRSTGPIAPQDRSWLVDDIDVPPPVARKKKPKATKPAVTPSSFRFLDI